MILQNSKFELPFELPEPKTDDQNAKLVYIVEKIYQKISKINMYGLTKHSIKLNDGLAKQSIEYNDRLPKHSIKYNDRLAKQSIEYNDILVNRSIK